MSRAARWTSRSSAWAAGSPARRDLFAFWENVLAGRLRPGRGSGTRHRDGGATESVVAALEDAGLTPDDLERRTSRSSAAVTPPVPGPGDGSTGRRRPGDGRGRPGHPRGGLRRVRGPTTGRGRADPQAPGRRRRDGDRIYAVVRDVLDAASPMPARAMPAAGIGRADPGSPGALPSRAACRTCTPPGRGSTPTPAARRDRAGSTGLRRCSRSTRPPPTPRRSDAGNPGAMLRWETEAILLSAPDRAAWPIGRASSPTGSTDHPGGGAQGHRLHAQRAGEPAAVPCRLGLVVSSPADLCDRLGRAARRGWPTPPAASIRDGRGHLLLGRAAGRAGRRWRSFSPARARSIPACSPTSASTSPRCARCSTPPTASRSSRATRCRRASTSSAARVRATAELWTIDDGRQRACSRRNGRSTSS